MKTTVAVKTLKGEVQLGGGRGEWGGTVSHGLMGDRGNVDAVDLGGLEWLGCDGDTIN